MESLNCLLNYVLCLLSAKPNCGFVFRIAHLSFPLSVPCLLWIYIEARAENAEHLFAAVEMHFVRHGMKGGGALRV